MKKFIFLSIVLLLLAGFAITSSAAMKVPLFADKDMEVGYIFLEVKKDCLLVSYSIDKKWELLETHLYVGTVEPTKSAPGRFPYGPESEYANDTDDGYTIPLKDIGVKVGDVVFIAAHEEIGMIDKKGNPVLDENGEQIKETTWADNGSEGYLIRPGNNWAKFFKFWLVEEK